VAKFEAARDIVEARRKDVESLDLGALERSDLLNLILQRSECLYDIPRAGRPVRAWVNGDPAPLESLVSDMGSEIAVRCAALIIEEFEQIKPLLSEAGVQTLVDIGSGYGFFDLFATRDLGINCTLVDLESNDRKHFGFANEGAAYSSLKVSEKLFRDNGLQCSAINPTKTDVMELDGPFDAVVSFLSCGFHYPTDLYLPFFQDKLAPNGLLILDVRAKRALSERTKLETIGRVEELYDNDGATRMLVRCA
jgi:SAM-dependent methyltransferase